MVWHIQKDSWCFSKRRKGRGTTTSGWQLTKPHMSLFYLGLWYTEVTKVSPKFALKKQSFILCFLVTNVIGFINLVIILINLRQYGHFVEGQPVVPMPTFVIDEFFLFFFYNTNLTLKTSNFCENNCGGTRK